MLQRATDGGVAALVAYTTDFEKVEALVRLARENAHVVYCMVTAGVAQGMWERHSCKKAYGAAVELIRCSIVSNPHSISCFLKVGVHSDMIKRSSDKLSAQVGHVVVCW